MRILLIVLITASLLVTAEKDQNLEQLLISLRPHIKTISSKNTLKFNEQCDYNFELVREKELRELYKVLSSIESGVGGRKETIIGIIKAMADVSGLYCNRYANLKCNSTGLCACAEEAIGYKMRFVYEDDACLVDEGFICELEDTTGNSPQENPLLTGAPPRELKCANKMNCVVRTNFKDCTAEAVEEEAQRIIAAGHGIHKEFDFKLFRAIQAICVCRGNTVVTSLILLFSSALISITRFIEMSV